MDPNNAIVIEIKILGCRRPQPGERQCKEGIFSFFGNGQEYFGTFPLSAVYVCRQRIENPIVSTDQVIFLLYILEGSDFCLAMRHQHRTNLTRTLWQVDKLLRAWSLMIRILRLDAMIFFVTILLEKCYWRYSIYRLCCRCFPLTAGCTLILPLLKAFLAPVVPCAIAMKNVPRL